MWDPGKAVSLSQAPGILQAEGAPASETKKEPGLTGDTATKPLRLGATRVSLGLPSVQPQLSLSDRGSQSNSESPACSSSRLSVEPLGNWHPLGQVGTVGPTRTQMKEAWTQGHPQVGQRGELERTATCGTGGGGPEKCPEILGRSNFQFGF